MISYIAQSSVSENKDGITLSSPESHIWSISVSVLTRKSILDVHYNINGRVELGTVGGDDVAEQSSNYTVKN